jgi:hypothetical protein
LNPHPEETEQKPLQLVRATREEKELQIRRLQAFQEAHREEAAQALKRLQSPTPCIKWADNTGGTCEAGQLTRPLGVSTMCM